MNTTRGGWSSTRDVCMSMTERLGTMAEPWADLEAAATPPGALPAVAPIVPRNSLAGRSLGAVVAIMTFLALLTTGAAMVVVSAAGDLESDVGREVTIQVRPAPGHDIEANLRKATEIARGAPGIADVQPYTKEESARLVEPWLGSGLALDDLPMPRLVVVKLLPGARPNFAALRQMLATQVSTATLDDHRRWIESMRTMAETA